MAEPKNELQRNAIAEARRIELETFQRALDIQWLNNRMEDGRMGRCLALIKKEAEMEKDFQEKTDHAAIVNERAKRETALGVEIANIKREEACKVLRRHYLRERDPSLRELAKKLQAGYVCRDLRLQIKNNEYRRLQEKAEDKKANDILCESLYNDKEAKAREEQAKMDRDTKYCRELQQQLVHRQLQKQCEYEDKIIERKMLEEVERTLADEDQRELKKKHDQTKKLAKEMVTFANARVAWRLKQKQMVINEEKQIEEQKRLLADRSSAIVAERERRVREKEELNQRIAAKILADEAEKQDRLNIIKMLQEQEYLEKNCQDDIKEREKIERCKRETKEALTAQMENKKRLIREQKIVDVNFRKEVEAKIKVENEKEDKKTQDKKQKNRQYTQELLKQIQDNEKRRAKEQDLEEKRALYVWETDDKWRAEVSKERALMVEEHVPELLGYLQAGVIGKEDLPSLRTGVQKKNMEKVLDIDSLTRSDRPKRHPKCNAQCRILREF